MNIKTVLVTGGNRGIGLAIVQAFAKDSTKRVLLGCRNIEEGEVLAGKLGKTVEAVWLDLSSREKLNQGVSEIKNKYGFVDILINNAAVLNEGPSITISQEKFDEALRVNTLAPYELIRAFAPQMIKNGFGRIVNISSGWGSFEGGLMGPFSYSFTKASLNALTLTIARELHTNVKINSMCPGWVRTRMGGDEAPRTPEQGAETALWLANLPEDGPSGGFFRDKTLIAW